MSVREQVRQAFHVEREMGDEMLVACPHPDHHDSHPSASINVKKRLWVCYSCGRGGRLQDVLGDRIADPNVEDLLAEISTSLAGFDSPDHGYPESWLDQFDAGPVHPYWRSRGLSDEVCERFRLGYDHESNRVTYPLRGPSGAVLGVVRRAVDNTKIPKYLYPPHAPISETLFGYHLLRSGVDDVVLVEGALDALAMWEVGVPAVAQLGSNLSRTQMRLLRKLGPRTITLAYDQDQAGRKALERAVTSRLLNFCPLRVMSWDEKVGKDPLDLDEDTRLLVYEQAQVTWSRC